VDEAVASPRNRRIARAVALVRRKDREEQRRFLVEGVRGVRDALESGVALGDVFHLAGSGADLEPVLRAARASGARVTAVSPEALRRLTATVAPQGIVAVAPFVDVPLADVVAAASLLAILVEVRDPGNLGTIVRAVDASGAGGLAVTEASVDLYNPKVVRAAAGSLFHVPVAHQVTVEDAVAAVRGRGGRVFAAAADGRLSIYEADLGPGAAVLFGNEARGLSAANRAMADATVRVPIRGAAESLNLAAATTVVLFEAARRRESAAAAPRRTAQRRSLH